MTDKKQSVKHLLEQGILEDNVERIKKGLKLSNEVTIACANCDEDLVKVIVVKETHQVSNFVVYCPCGDHSFQTQVIGQTYIDTVDGVFIKDIQTSTVKAEVEPPIIDLRSEEIPVVDLKDSIFNYEIYVEKQ